MTVKSLRTFFRCDERKLSFLFSFVVSESGMTVFCGRLREKILKNRISENAT
jgi:hypothetical protein